MSGARDVGLVASRRREKGCAGKVSDITEVFDAIGDERMHQIGKYGSDAARNLSIGDYLVILRQELDEAERAFVGETTPATLLEVLQVAAVAVACLERHGVVRREIRRPVQLEG